MEHLIKNKLTETFLLYNYVTAYICCTVGGGLKDINKPYYSLSVFYSSILGGRSNSGYICYLLCKELQCLQELSDITT